MLVARSDRMDFVDSPALRTVAHCTAAHHPLVAVAHIDQGLDQRQVDIQSVEAEDHPSEVASCVAGRIDLAGLVTECLDRNVLLLGAAVLLPPFAGSLPPSFWPSTPCGFL